MSKYAQGKPLCVCVIVCVGVSMKKYVQRRAVWQGTYKTPDVMSSSCPWDYTSTHVCECVCSTAVSISVCVSVCGMILSHVYICLFTCTRCDAQAVWEHNNATRCGSEKRVCSFNSGTNAPSACIWACALRVGVSKWGYLLLHRPVLKRSNKPRCWYVFYWWKLTHILCHTYCIDYARIHIYSFHTIHTRVVAGTAEAREYVYICVCVWEGRCVWWTSD